MKPSELSLIYVPIILKILLSEDFSVNSFVILSFVYNQAEIENRSHFLGWESAFKYQLDVFNALSWKADNLEIPPADLYLMFSD